MSITAALTLSVLQTWSKKSMRLRVLALHLSGVPYGIKKNVISHIIKLRLFSRKVGGRIKYRFELDEDLEMLY